MGLMSHFTHVTLASSASKLTGTFDAHKETLFSYNTLYIPVRQLAQRR